MTRQPTYIARPPLRYHGGKWLLADWIISLMPAHQVYCEPFGGGASVLLRKPPCFLETYNDLNREVVNFFRVLREQPDELVRLIDLTPFSREEFALCKKADGGSNLERARRFYCVSWQSRGAAGMKEKGGWRHLTKYGTRHKTCHEDFNNTKHLYAIAARLKKCQIENLSAIECMTKYDGANTLHYLDPPYMHDTRGRKGTLHKYAHDMSDEQHVELLTFLRTLRGMVILSGYDSQIYHEMLPGWSVYAKETLKDNHAGRVSEMLWVSPNAARKTLFD